MTKGQIEAKISDAVSKFEIEYMGRGPKEIRTKIIQEHILIVINGFLSQSEKKLSEDPSGARIVKDARRALFESSRECLVSMIKEIISINVISTHSDVSTKTGEKIIVLTTDSDLEKQFKK